MESSRTEVSYLHVMSEDVQSFDEVAELYFEARDNVDNEEIEEFPVGRWVRERRRIQWRWFYMHWQPGNRLIGESENNFIPSIIRATVNSAKIRNRVALAINQIARAEFCKFAYARELFEHSAVADARANLLCRLKRLYFFASSFLLLIFCG